VNFVGIDKRHPIAGRELFVEAQTNISGGSKAAKRRAIDDQPAFLPEGAQELSLTIKSVAASAIDASIALKNGSSRAPRIKWAATSPTGLIVSAIFLL
jgi:hypothetical protein